LKNVFIFANFYPYAKKIVRPQKRTHTTTIFKKAFTSYFTGQFLTIWNQNFEISPTLFYDTSNGYLIVESPEAV